MPVRRHMQEEDDLMSYQSAMQMANAQRASFIPQEPFIPSTKSDATGDKSNVISLW